MTTVGMSTAKKIAKKIAKMKGAQMKARNMKMRQMIAAENARIGMKIMKTVEINAARRVATMVNAVDAETITAEIMISAEIAPFRVMKHTGMTREVAFLTRIVVISIQTQQKNSTTSMQMGPTHSIGMSMRSFRIILKRNGEN